MTDFWNCDCKVNYVRPIQVDMCGVCGRAWHGAPASTVDAVIDDRLATHVGRLNDAVWALVESGGALRTDARAILDDLDDDDPRRGLIRRLVVAGHFFRAQADGEVVTDTLTVQEVMNDTLTTLQED